MKTAILKSTRSAVTILSVLGGWTSIKLADGTEQKVRNSALEVEGDVSPAKKAPAKAKKAPTKAKRRAAAEGGDEEDEEELDDDGVKIRPDLSKYTAHEIKTASGGRALDISDEAADLLRGQDLSDCYFIVAKHLVKNDKTIGTVDIVEAGLKEKYAGLNKGMQRMNLGNRLRKAMGTYGNLNAHKTVKAPKTKIAAKKAAPKSSKTDKAAELFSKARQPQPSRRKSKTAEARA